MFLAWHDNDRKRKPAEKLGDAIERYIEKFGSDPTTCLVHPEFAKAIQPAADQRHIELRRVTFLPANTFFVGDDEPYPRSAEAA